MWQISSKLEREEIMSWVTALPYWKILPFVLYVVMYFHVTELKDRQYPEENYKSVLFKALPMLSVVFIVLSAADCSRQHTTYKRLLSIGLLFSMAGDACLIWRVKLFLPGLLLFAIAHVFYIAAFGFKPFGGGPTFVSTLIIGVTIYSYLYHSIDDNVMKVFVFLYNVLIMLMAWRSLVRVMQHINTGTVCALIGAVLFIVSDMMIAIDKWRFKIKDGSYWIMVTYYSAQLLIGLSAAAYVRNDAGFWKKKRR